MSIVVVCSVVLPKRFHSSINDKVNNKINNWEMKWFTRLLIAKSERERGGGGPAGEGIFFFQISNIGFKWVAKNIKGS